VTLAISQKNSARRYAAAHDHDARARRGAGVEYGTLLMLFWTLCSTADF
jgi:hypothetical protein